MGRTQSHSAGWRRVLHPVFFFLAAWPAAALEAADLRNGAIVVSPNAHPAERYAAEELQGLIARAMDMELPIRESARGRAAHVYIGAGAAPRRHPLAIDTKDMGEEAFAIRAGPAGAAIAGGSPRGTLYGVYHFAETRLGVRFLTADHTHVPHNPALVIPDGEERYEPPFAYRWVFASELNDHPAFMVRLRNNPVVLEDRFGGGSARPLISHSLLHQVPVETYGADHPKYFAEIDGVRKLSYPDAPQSAPQVHPLHRDLPAIVAEAVEREFAEHPARPVVSVSPNDSPHYCQCAACAALIRWEQSPIAPHLSLVNAVARRVAPSRVGTLAYWTLRSPPRSLRPEANVDIQYCTFEASGLYALNDPASAVNAAVYRDLRVWREKTPHLYVWHYITNLRHVDLPYPNHHTLAADIRAFRDLGVKGLFLQANGRCPGGEFADLKVYVASRLLWDPSLDGAALAAEFIALHYGPAGPIIQSALDELTAALRNSGKEPDCWSSAAENGYTPAIAKAFADRIDVALAVVRGTEYEPRVAKLLSAALKARLLTEGRYILDEGVFRVAYPDDLDNLLDRYESAAAAIGLDRDSEFSPLGSFTGAIAGTREGLAVATREVGEWTLQTLPGASARVVSLSHGPSVLIAPEAMARPELPVNGIVLEIERDGAAIGTIPFVVGEDGRLLYEDEEISVTQFFETAGTALRHRWRIAHRGVEPARYRASIRIVEAQPALHIEVGGPNIESIDRRDGRIDLRGPAVLLHPGGAYEAAYRAVRVSHPTSQSEE